MSLEIENRSYRYIDQMFPSPQVKWSVIITNKHVYVLPHELSKDL